MNANAYAIYLLLLENPRDWDRMLVLADALEDSGEDDLAHAYRWAARRGKWPFEKNVGTKNEFVYDWDRERPRGIHGNVPDIPECAKIPIRLHHYLIRLVPDDKKYGDVNDAFVLLARALKAVGDE